MVTLRKRPPKPKQESPPKRASRSQLRLKAQLAARRQSTKKETEEQRLLEWNREREKLRKHSKRKATTPVFLTCPRTNQKIWFKSCTKENLVDAEKRGHGPNQDKLQLVTVASNAIRKELYDICAKAVGQLETELLPKYGRRPWTVNVKISDPTQNGKGVSPLFCWNGTGRLQPASLPFWVERMPPPKKTSANAWPSQTDAQNGGEQHIEGTELDSTLVAVQAMLDFKPDPALAQMAQDERWRVPFPNLSVRWISPLHESLPNRKAAATRAKELVKEDRMLSKYLQGVDNGKLLKQPLQSSRKQVLKVGKLRFLRDGLWVVGQEEWWHGECPHADTLPVKASPSKKGRALTALNYFLQCRRKEYQQERLAELRKKRDLQKERSSAWKDAISATVPGLSDNTPERDSNNTETTEQSTKQPSHTSPSKKKPNKPKKKEQPVTFTLQKADQELRAIWRSMKKGERAHWEAEATKARLEAEGDLSSKENAKTSPVGVTEAVKVAKSGEEQPEPMIPSSESKPPEPSVEEVSTLSSTSQTADKPPESCTNNLVQVSEHSIESKKPLSVSSTVEVCQDKSAGRRTIDGVQSAQNVEQPCGTPIDKPAMEISGEVVSCSEASEDRTTPPCTNLVGTSASNEQPPAAPSTSDANAVAPSVPDSLATANDSAKTASTITVPSASLQNKEVAVEPATEEQEEEQFFSRPVGPSSDWCLSHEQVQLCYDAGMEHFDQVLDTVKARDLWRELQDGFDVLRERGKGRYDMELPAFDEPQFSFLADTKKAPWMPVVREILGKDVVLIHKGMFLSLPGAEKQVYHQDGPHLTTQYQKPCHAVNVFVPLVDLSLENGPTEFCLGSHILGQDEWKSEYLETPTVEAGTPVIFDYRLGHNGLENTSSISRPVVYCTYAAKADGKEFRDSVNFSSKRYHKIGKLVSKAPGREERAKKRERALAEEQLNAVLTESLNEGAQSKRTKPSESNE